MNHTKGNRKGLQFENVTAASNDCFLKNICSEKKYCQEFSIA